MSISGKELSNALRRIGYLEISQRGSHIKVSNPEIGHTVVIPSHKELKEWTLNGILGDVSEKLWLSKLDLLFRIKSKR